MKRGAGILMPIHSLPSPYGFGTLGKEAYQMVDFLKDAKQTYWQVLPIGPTSYGDSPYQATSTFAGNPYMIDLDLLAKDGLLKPSEYKKRHWGYDARYVDYETLYHEKYRVLRLACNRMPETKDYQQFIKKENDWLHDYALFMTIKYANQGLPFYAWPTPLRKHNQNAIAKFEKKHAEDIVLWQKVQYLFYKQWNQLKEYANQNGIQIIGDLPIYVPLDSVDVWANAKQFLLDKECRPTLVAGCPPDGFTADGQLWGNPIYDWKAMKKDNYQWWVKRIRKQMQLFDVLRIDHFRGFASYYAIPYGEETARHGHWEEGPGYALFKTVEKKLGKIQLIAEDLGFLTEDVIELVKKTGYPGMKVLQFAFDVNDPNSMYLPHTYDKNSIVYTGTHDNDTIVGWFKSAPHEQVTKAKNYFHITKEEGNHWGMIRGAYASTADIAIIPIQDFLGYDAWARMNTPSTLGDNWCWRLEKGKLTKALSHKIAQLVHLYGRAG